MLHHLSLLHNKIKIKKVTEYHNITLTYILILIEEESEDKIHIPITKTENIPRKMANNKETKGISTVCSVWTMSMDMYIN